MGLSLLPMVFPKQLVDNCRRSPERKAWLERLPAMLEELTARWSVRVGAPFEHADVTCSWVAPVVCADGAEAVLKLGMPHMEGAQEIQGLRFWDGDPTVRLLQADDGLGAMLLERCQPGYTLHSKPEHNQDAVIASLLKRLWRRAASPNVLHEFRHLSKVLEYWRDETLAQADQWPDAGLVREGLKVLQTLATPLPTDTLLPPIYTQEMSCERSGSRGWRLTRSHS
jgi:streptomycin 6-kinase